MAKSFKNIEALGEGIYLVKVIKADKWNKDLNQGRGGFEKGTQQTVVSQKTGQVGYKYNIESTIVNGEEKPLRYDNGEGKEYRYSILAWDEKSKAIMDSGVAEIKIVPKVNKDGEESYKKDAETGEIVQELRYFINPAKDKMGMTGVENIDNNGDGSTKLWKAPKEPSDDVPVIEDGEDILDPDYIDPDSVPL